MLHAAMIGIKMLATPNIGKVMRKEINSLRYLVAVHRSPLRVAAELPVSRGTDRSATSAVVACCTAFLQGQKLLGTESLVMNLAGRFN